MPEPKARLAWLWVGAGFLFQSLPAALRDEALPVALKKAAVTDTYITQLAALLGLLVGIKILWAPIVVRLGSPLRIVGASQALIVVIIGMMTLVAPQSREYPLALFTLFALLSLISAGHDVALDGYYVASLSDCDRGRLSGTLSAFSKIGAALGGSGVIWIAGQSVANGSEVAAAWADALLAATVCAATAWIICSMAMAREPAKEPEPQRPILQSIRSLILDSRFPVILLLIILYRASENHLVPILRLFSLSPNGLNLTEGTYATLRLVTMAGVAIGGVIASITITRIGLKRAIMPLGCVMHMPILAVAWLATHPGQNLITIGAVFFIEYVAFGAGVCALLLAMMRLAEGPDAAVRYATLSTFAIGAVYVPGMWAGALADHFGYANYFLLTLVLAPAGIWASVQAKRALG